MLTNARAAPNPPFVPVTLTTILLTSGAGVLVPALFDVGSSDGFFKPSVLTVLAIVGVADVVAVRLILLPQLLGSEGPRRIQEPESDLGTLALNSRVLAAALSIAPSVYGAVGAIMTASWWFAPPLAALGLLSAALSFPYVDNRIAERAREQRSRGEA